MKPFYIGVIIITIILFLLFLFLNKISSHKHKPLYTINPGQKIALVTCYTSEISEYAVEAVKNHTHYALLNGYTYYVYNQDNVKPRHPCWNKIIALLNNIKKHQHIVWVDADAVITNMSVKIENFINKSNGADLLVCKDNGGWHFNSGVMIFKNTPWTYNLISKVWNIPGPHDYTTQGDQPAFINVIGREVDKKCKKEGKLPEQHIKHCPRQHPKVKIFEEREFNCHPKNWKDGDFIMHMMCSVAHPNQYRKDKIKEINNKNIVPVALYVISYNAPKQFKLLLDSIEKAEPQLLNICDKYLLNNTTEPEFMEDYSKLCKQHNFTEIKKGNLGITGGRVYCAKHFDASNNDYMLWFEDDMLLHTKNKKCRNKMYTKVPNFLMKSIDIMKKENLDYLKLSYTEYYMDNDVNCSWYNCTPKERQELFPENANVPIRRKHVPKTIVFKNDSLNGVDYSVGEYYYANWPHLISKRGNKIIFIDNNLTKIIEHRLMVLVQQLVRAKKLRVGILLASLVNHHREYNYKNRKETFKNILEKFSNIFKKN